ELQYVTRLMGPKRIFEEYFRDEPVHYDNPEYMYFFNEFYEGLMLQLIASNKKPEIRNIVNNGTPYDSLLVYVQEHEWIEGKQLAELFILRGLYDLYYKAAFDKYKIENLLQEARKSTSSTEIRNTIDNFQALINRLKPGSPYIPFEGKKPDGTVVQSSDLIAKPLYVIFFSPDDPNSLKEVPGVNNQYDDYRREINFVGLCSGCTYSSLQEFMATNKLKFDCLIVDPSLEAA